ncbi:hypothetical protein HMPREF9080_00967 [Cardiobacterium valvarum F0432]|uniref:Uncharacterized protein n=1 Tax=Cardiobacterium valvarum F0432 TaxID=797473 RepID=G9ZDZ5_9GAMM|nr:hypothetical protein HMPREF9080_00967 [Cardiobacterium valvarum F0432]
MRRAYTACRHTKPSCPSTCKLWDEPSTAAKHSAIRKSVGYRKQ